VSPRFIFFAKALAPGDRWITIHPHGKDEKGQPVLVHPAGDGAFKVIGGAGGSLNHLRLTNIRPAGEYAATIKERAEKRRAMAKEQVARDKESGIHEAKTAMHTRLSERKGAADAEFVRGVSDAMGWSKEETAFDESLAEGVPEHVANQMRKAHLRDVVKKAKDAVALNRERILTDADARAEADLGEVPINSESASTLSIQDLDPVRTGSMGLGFATNYRARAADAGSDIADIKAEVTDVKPEITDNQRKAAIANGETAKMVAAGLDVMRDRAEPNDLAPKLVEAKKAVELLKLAKKFSMVEKQTREARKKINETMEEPKALVVEADESEIDKAVADDVANDLRTISTRSFLNEVARAAPNPTKTLGKHIGVGAYNSVNAVALAAGGAALVDRSVVDVLGIAGASEVLARRLQSDLSEEEFKAVADGMEDFHLHHYMEASEEALGRARELTDQAAEIELTAADNGDDLAAMQEVNRLKAAAISESQKVLGQALGEMEANASLVYAMKRGKSDKPFNVSLGDMPLESAITQLRAIGLERGDYTIEKAAGNVVVKVQPHGLDRLAKPVARDDLLQVRRNLDIIGGSDDEEGWLPEGMTDRPDLDMHVKPGVAESLARPFDPPADGPLEGSIRDYIGGRAADGDTPADILSDLQSLDFMRKVGSDRIGEYQEALDKLAPLQEGGKLKQADSLRPAFESMADEYVQARYGEDRKPIHRQDFTVDHTSMEALHRALAAEPTGVAAYKPVGELTPQDQGALREFFAKNIAHESPEAGALRKELESMPTKEPEKTVEDMFGETSTNPEWTDWKAHRDELATKVNAASMTWPKYVESMRRPEAAYAAMQDLVRSKVSKAFADTMNTLNPKAPLKIGRTTVRDNLNHLDAVDPKARDARLAKERALTDSLRERAQGRYAAGSVRDKLDAARDMEAGEAASQMGFFATEPEAKGEAPPGPDERYTVGQEAERRIAEMMPTVGANFKPGSPVPLFRPTLSGGKNWPRQRAIKMLDANKRVVLSFGTGSGKTMIGLGGFSHLHSQGKAKRGLFLVPSISQGQYGAEALRFLEPGKFNWHAKPGASQAERIAAYKDRKHDFAVMTHQSFRDDMIHLGATHAGVEESEMSDRLAKMDRGERKEWMRATMRREGINFDFLNVDEGHDLLNRKGKANSAMSNVVDSLSDNTPYYLNGSADPVKNDASEAFSLLQKMDPGRYTDQAAFMRQYGVDTPAAKDSLRRELARFQYPSKIDPEITATRSERSVPVSDAQKNALADLDKSIAGARLARMQGKVDVEAMKKISPSSFTGVPEDEHEALASALQKNLGIMRQSAVKRVLDAHPEGGKINAVVDVAKEHAGKQGVVFAHSLAAVSALRDRLTREGYRVATITGGDSAKEKSKRIDEFRPAEGDSNVDILVASDAGATGANLQSGRWLANFDTPDTAKTHAQRNGRINRIGQTHDVDLIDLVSDHPEEKKARDRLTRKYALREMMTTPMESLDDTGVGYFIRQRQIAAANGGAL
jgi:superfamily II DNA or RNA helicase